MVVFAVWTCIDGVAGCVRARESCVDGSVIMRCDAVVASILGTDHGLSVIWPYTQGTYCAGGSR